MLTADVRFEGWTTEDWLRFLHLWAPRATPDREATRPRGGLFVIYDGPTVRKMLHTKKGRLEAGVPWPAGGSPQEKRARLGELAAEHHASWGLAAHFGALDEVMERFGERARRGDDLTTQALSLVTIVRELMAEGKIESWPRRLHGIPPPTDVMVRKAMDALCADGHAMALGLFKDEALWTAFVARRRGPAFDVIAGPDELRPAMGLLSGDWRRDYRHLVRAVEDRYAPLAFGCFADMQIFRELQTDARPGAWSRAVAVRDVVLSPMPMAIGMALGVDGARFAYENLRVVTRGLAPFGLIEPVLKGVRTKISAVTGKDVSGALGFDPLAALRALLRR